MGIIGWVILGALAGWIASLITGQNARMGCLANVGVGIVGALIGGAIFSEIAGAGITGFDLWSLFVAVIGSTILLLIVGLFTSR